MKFYHRRIHLLSWVLVAVLLIAAFWVVIEVDMLSSEILGDEIYKSFWQINLREIFGDKTTSKP